MSIPLKRDPLTRQERDGRLKELEYVVERCHRGANTEWRAMVDLDWARRYERTIRLLEKEVREVQEELELRLRGDLGDKIVDESLKILREPLPADDPEHDE
jgi:hypothetical protein